MGVKGLGFLNESNFTVNAKDYRVLLGNLSHAQKYDISVKPNYKDRDDFADTNDIKRKDEISKLPVATRPPKLPKPIWLNVADKPADLPEEIWSRCYTKNGTKCMDYDCKDLDPFDKRNSSDPRCRHSAQIYLNLEKIRTVAPTLDYLDYINVRYCEEGPECTKVSDLRKIEDPIQYRVKPKQTDITLQLRNLEAASTYLVQVNMDTSFKSFLSYGQGEYSDIIKVDTGPKGTTFNDILKTNLGVTDLDKNRESKTSLHVTLFFITHRND